MDNLQPSNEPSTSSSSNGYPPSTPLASESVLKRWRPRITGYQLLYIVFTAGFGFSKASLAYRGHSTAPTTLDWLYGVVVFLWFYWLGLYDRHSSQRFPRLFETNYLAFLWNIPEPRSLTV